MLTHAIAFIAGGYLIPASMHFVGIWQAEKSAPDNPTWGERFMTAFMEAALWPLNDGRYEPKD